MPRVAVKTVHLRHRVHVLNQMSTGIEAHVHTFSVDDGHLNDKCSERVEEHWH